jgi:uncharacterized surface protein with fasciclin (FAS1) repeats
MPSFKTALRMTVTAAAFAASMSGAALAQDYPMVGGAPMMPTMTIPENASQASNLTTLVAAVGAAGLVDTLASPGPFTVFAPTNDAFAMLPAGTVEGLLEPDMKDTLTAVLTYHVVPGNYNVNALAAAMDAGGGTAELTTVQGGTLTVSMEGDGIVITDEAGGTAMVTQADVTQANGVVHVIDHVLMPAM